MKKIILLTATSIIMISAVRAQVASCCSPQDQFVAFAGDAAFVSAHATPVPFTYISEKGHMATFPCNDGKNGNAFVISAEIPTNQFVFVFHEWWGLNDYIKQETERIYNDLGAKVNVMAIDLYDGKIAILQDSAKVYMKQLTDERARSIISGAIQITGSNSKVATIGWCMGGGYSLQTSIMLRASGVGCVMFYGMPETKLEQLQQLNCNVLMIWADQDKWINKEVVDAFKANMETAGKKLEVQEYAADHAFANPSNPKYNSELAQGSYESARNFLIAAFKAK